MLKDLVARMIEARGYKIVPDDSSVYRADGLTTVHNHDFVRDPDFARAYARGVVAAGEDYDWQWRVHIGLWAAASAARLDGDFVECGVNRGFLSSAIMELLDWDTLGKTFWLLDTFASATFDQIDSAYREAGGDPFVAASILSSTQDMHPPQPPAATGSLAAQWIWWKKGWSEAQAGCDGRYGHGRGRDWQGVHTIRG